MKKNSKKRNRIVLISLLLSAVFIFRAFADEPGQLSALDDETRARLSDHTAEWDEIQNLVTYRNPTYRLYADGTDSTNAQLSQAGDSFSDEMETNLEAIDENLAELKEKREKLAGLPGSTVIDEKGTTVSQMLAQLDAAEASLKKTRADLKKGIGKVNTMVTDTRITAEETLKPVREQIAHTVENLFISYAQLKINRSLVEKQIALYEQMLSMEENLKEKDMATAAEINSAGASLAEARNTLASVDNGLTQLRTAIGQQLGWSADDPPEIGDVPAPDVNFPLSADKEADYKKALDNNSAYETAGKLSSYTGSAALEKREAAMNEANAGISVKFDSLYVSMQQQKALYDASQTSLKLAELKKARAERMLSLGMVSRTEYMGLQLEYLSTEASARLAELSLVSAINEYKWAVRGYMDY